jgi:hypothetical protein
MAFLEIVPSAWKVTQEGVDVIPVPCILFKLDMIYIVGS